MARAWLTLAVSALAIACVLAIVLVLLRTPFVGEYLVADAWFPVGLVLHVDLALLVWLPALAAMLWSLGAGGFQRWLGWLALGLGVLGAGVLVFAGVRGGAVPVLNNYVPVLNTPLFFIGLLTWGAGVGLAATRQVWAFCAGQQEFVSPPLAWGAVLSALGWLLVLLTFALSWAQMPLLQEPPSYYEMLFWGGGHALQFVYLLLAVIGWIWLAIALGLGGKLDCRLWGPTYALLLLPLLISPLLALWFPPDSSEYRAGFTALMRYLCWWGIPGIATWLLLVSCAVSVSPVQALYRRALRASIGVLLLGLVVGALIRGDTLLVPAHYHGTTGAVNLALMGVVYALSQGLGLESGALRLQARQLGVYAVGVVCLVAGLTWSGWLGVARKVSGEAQGLSSLQEQVAMLSMGVGASIALAGCFLFLGILFRTLRIFSWGRYAELAPVRELRGEARGE